MRIVYRHPWLNIIVIIFISLFFAVQIPNTTLDNDVMNFIPEEHPEAKAYKRTSDLFGSRMILGAGIEFTDSTIFAPDHTDLIRRLTGQFEQLDHVESVLSLSNTDYIEGTPEGMTVNPLIGEDYPGTAQDIRELKLRLSDWPIYRNVLYSGDFTAAQILVTFEEDLEAEQREELYFSIKEVLDAEKKVSFRYYLAGNPAITVLVTDNMKADLVTLIPMVVVAVLAALYISFRRIGGVLISMLTVLLSTIWTVGAMALLRVPLSMVATVIPVLMIAVGSAYGIHIISHYYDEIDLHPDGADPETHRDIIFRTMHKIGRPVFLAGLTTIAGFGALSTSRVIPMRNFGIFTAFGVLAAVIVALIFIPSLLLVGKRALQAAGTGGAEASPRAADHKIVLAIYHFFSRHKMNILLLAVLLAGLGILGTSKVIRDNAIIEYFKEQTEIRQADRFLREKFAGTEFFDIVVRGEKKGDLTHPEILKTMDNMAAYLEKEFAQVARVNSFTDLIKRMNQVMNYPPAPPVMASASTTQVSTAQESSAAAAAPDSPESPAAPEKSGSGSEGFSSFFETEDNFGGSFDEGFEEGFSVQADTSRGTQYTDQFDSGPVSINQPGSATQLNNTTQPGSALDWQRNLQPVDFSQEFTYGEFVLLMNEIYADTGYHDLSAGELIEALKRRTNYRGAAYYEVPYDPEKYPAVKREELRNLISQYLLLYSGSMDEWADDAIEPRQVRMNVQLTTTGSRETVPIIEAAYDYAGKNFPAGYTAEITGSALVKNALTDLLIDAQTRSILISLSLVFLIVSINFRSLIAGLFGIVPMGFAILINFAVMGYFGIKLDISTAMVASVAIGIGIDYTIHFMSNYHYERLRSDDIETVSINTLRTTGKAITFNAFAVAAGFLVLIFSQFNPLMYLGMLIALTMFTSSLGAMTLLPVLLNIFRPRFISKKIKSDSIGG